MTFIKTSIVAIFASAALLAQIGQTARADSLYTCAPNQSTVVNRAPVSYFSDAKAHGVGDLVTVVISENASGTSSGATSGSKSESAQFGSGMGAILNLIHSFSLSGSEDSKAAAATNRADNLTATIACTVQQVLPDGNFLIQGSRSVGVNAETQTITLTGEVRPIDISPLNTVASPLVANANIKYSGKGPVGEVQHDGLIRRIFRLVF